MQLPAPPKQIVNPLRPLRKNASSLFFFPFLSSLFFPPSKVVRKIPMHAAPVCGTEALEAKIHNN